MNSEIDPNSSIAAEPGCSAPSRNVLFDPTDRSCTTCAGPGLKWRAKYRRARNGDGISSPRPIHLVRRIDGRNPHDRSKPRFLW